MSNFSFSHSVFKSLVVTTHKNKGLFGKGLKQKNTCTGFHVTVVKYLTKTVKGKKFRLPRQEHGDFPDSMGQDHNMQGPLDTYCM